MRGGELDRIAVAVVVLEVIANCQEFVEQAQCECGGKPAKPGASNVACSRDPIDVHSRGDAKLRRAEVPPQSGRALVIGWGGGM